MSHDTKCRDLAEAFLEDMTFKTPDDRESAAADLAEDIQQAIEDWILLENIRRDKLASVAPEYSDAPRGYPFPSESPAR